MLRCEMDAYEAIDNALMADAELMAELEAQIYEDCEIMTESEANEFINWLYDDFDDVFDISKSELWKLCNSNIDCNFSNLNITIFDDCDNVMYQGLALDYPYDWYDCYIDDYNTYNIENKVYMDIWAHFHTWK